MWAYPETGRNCRVRAGRRISDRTLTPSSQARTVVWCKSIFIRAPNCHSSPSERAESTLNYSMSSFHLTGQFAGRKSEGEILHPEDDNDNGTGIIVSMIWTSKLKFCSNERESIRINNDFFEKKGWGNYLGKLFSFPMDKRIKSKNNVRLNVFLSWQFHLSSPVINCCSPNNLKKRTCT